MTLDVLVTVRWVLAALLCGAAALLLLANWGALCASLWYRWSGRGQHSSLVPLVGPVTGTLGLLVCPAETGWYAAAFWVLEPLVVLSPWALAHAGYRFLRRA
jgi:hypothetical protein